MFDILDFDANFKAYSEKWIEMNKGKFKTFEQMEDAMPEVYMRWLNSPAAFLEGEAPGTYFAKYTSAPELVKWMRLYDEADVSVPDQLLDRIADLGEESVKPLLFTAKNEAYSPALRIMAMNLLKELDAAEDAFEMALAVIDRKEEEDELADVAAELITDCAEEHKDELLERLPDVTDAARETYLDLLCNCPGDGRVYEAVMDAFLKTEDKYALYASFLGKLGDDRAIPALTKALDEPELNYLDYLEIRSAIEALGGECNHEREFAGDPYYETLKGQN